MITRGIAALCAAVMALGNTFAYSQQPQQPRYAERVDVERVLIDVRVVDGIGQPVLGLAAEDFRVKIGKKPAAVQSIAWVGAAASKDAATTPATLRSSA